MEQIKINALLNYLGETTETTEVETLKHDDNKTVFIDGAEYLVLTDEEADQEYHEYQMNLIDDLGLDSFSDWARDEILNHHTTSDYQNLFDEIQEESMTCYIDDLRHMDELEEEMENAGCDNEDEFLEYLCDQEDSVDYFKFNFGNDEYERIIKENDLIDWDSVIEWTKDIDGRDCMASYDGNEMELENNLYAYRIN
jgi:hypothetical protein